MIWATAMSALGFFRSKAGVYVLIGIAVLGGLWTIHHLGYNAGTKHEHTVMQKRLDGVQHNYDTCKANGLKLQTAIDRQNAALTAIQQEADRKLAETSKALQQAQRSRSAAEKSAAALLVFKPTGKTAGDRCLDVYAKSLDGN
jgi:hypothetical protein